MWLVSGEKARHQGALRPGQGPRPPLTKCPEKRHHVRRFQPDSTAVCRRVRRPKQMCSRAFSPMKEVDARFFPRLFEGLGPRRWPGHATFWPPNTALKLQALRLTTPASPPLPQPPFFRTLHARLALCPFPCFRMPSSAGTSRFPLCSTRPTLLTSARLAAPRTAQSRRTRRAA